MNFNPSTLVDTKLCNKLHKSLLSANQWHTNRIKELGNEQVTKIQRAVEKCINQLDVELKDILEEDIYTQAKGECTKKVKRICSMFIDEYRRKMERVNIPIDSQYSILCRFIKRPYLLEMLGLPFKPGVERTLDQLEAKRCNFPVNAEKTVRTGLVTLCKNRVTGDNIFFCSHQLHQLYARSLELPITRKEALARGLQVLEGEQAKTQLMESTDEQDVTILGEENSHLYCLYICPITQEGCQRPASFVDDNDSSFLVCDKHIHIHKKENWENISHNLKEDMERLEALDMKLLTLQEVNDMMEIDDEMDDFKVVLEERRSLAEKYGLPTSVASYKSLMS